MTSIPAVGEVFGLSQTARDIGRTFGTRAGNIPSEFIDVDREVRTLADALRLFGHSLGPDNVATRADLDTQEAVDIIFASAQTTLRDLELCVERHSTIRKVQTFTGFAVQKTWSDSAIIDYARVAWTARDGNMGLLRALLTMHRSTILLLSQAVQRYVDPVLKR